MPNSISFAYAESSQNQKLVVCKVLLALPRISKVGATKDPQAVSRKAVEHTFAVKLLLRESGWSKLK
jgi:hypothetical protein